MSAARPLSRAALGTLLAGLVMTLAACDTTTPPSVTPTPSATSASGRCAPELLEVSGIDGRVVDADGNPLEDIFILIETGSFRGDTRTAADGVFTAPGVTGEFAISTVDIDHVPVTQRVTVPCGETVEVELVLTPVEE